MNFNKMNYRYISQIKHFAKTQLQNGILRAMGIAFLLFFALPSQATHIVGGELYYECLGDNQYKITLTVYRDCLTGVAQFDDPASIGIFDGTTGQLGINQLIDEVRIDFDPAINDTLDIEAINPCLEIVDPVCIHRTIYVDTINLPFRTGGYLLAYQRCCRNAAIVNIGNTPNPAPTDQGATYTARVTEEALNSCDSSPIFNDWPPIFVCINRSIDFDHSASDANGDSLVYRMCNPNLGATKAIPKPQPPNNPPYDDIVYFPPFSTDDMLGNPDDPLFIDPVTGFLTGTPTIKGQFVVGICVEEYDRETGVLISTTRRDFQYIVGECIEITSDIGNPDIQCDDLQVNFINESLDADNFIWNFGDPTNPSASSTDMNPSYTYPDTGQYVVTLISQPGDQCADTLEWILNLRNATLEPNFDTYLLKCEDGVEIVVNNVSTDQFNMITDYMWETSDGQTSTQANPTFVVTGTDNVTITLNATSNDGCTRTVDQVVDLSDISDGIPRDTLTACEGDMLELFPTGPDFTILNYEWTPADGLSNPAIVNPTIQASTDNSGLYSLAITSGNSSCISQIEKYIQVSDINNVDIGATVTNTTDGSTTSVVDTDVVVTCNDETVTLTTTNISTNVTSYVWSTDAGNVPANADGSINVAPDGATTYTVVITDELGCTASNQITVNPNPVNIQVDEITNINTGGGGINDVTGDGILDLCPDQVGSLNASNFSADNNLTYTWTGDTQIITAGINSSNPTITANEADGVFNLTVTATNADGCSQSVDVPVEIHGIPEIDVEVEFTDMTTNTTTTITEVDEIVVCGDETALLSITSVTTLESDVNYTWYDSNGEIAGMNGDLLVITPNGEETYTLIATNAAGCTSETSFSISGSPVNVVIEETDDNLTNGSGLTDLDGDGTLDLCIGNPAALTVVNNDPNDINTYVWTGDTQILVDPTVQSPAIDWNIEGVYTLMLETTNQYGCTQNDVVLIQVHDSPDIDIDVTITDTVTGEDTTITGQDVITSCDDGLIILNTTGITSTSIDASIEWFDENGNSLGIDDNITVDPDGEETFSVVATDRFGCPTTTQVTIQGSPIDITIEQTVTDTDGNGFPDLDVNGDGSLDLCPNENFPITVTNNDTEQTLTYNWSVSDASVNIFGQNSANPAFEPTQAGTYEITVETINQWGCSEVNTIPITVLSDQQPNVNSVLQDCIGLTMNFDVNNPNAGYYTWDFGDGTILPGTEAPSHTYDMPGTYTVNLTPIADLSCLTPISQEVTVDDSVVEIGFDFVYTDCGPDGVTISFTDESNTSQGAITFWNWDFGNGMTSTEQNPSITTSDTELTVTLMITNDTGCDGSNVESLTVSPTQLIDTPSDLVSCFGDAPIELNPNANPDYTYTWDNGIGNEANPSIDPATTTTYNVTITNNSGSALCEVTQSITVQTSDEIGIVLDATGNNSGTFEIDNTVESNTITTCDDEQVNVTTTTTTGNQTDYTFEWNPQPSDATDFVVGVDGSQTFSLTVTDELGCTETTSLTVQGGPVDIEIEQTSVTNVDGGNTAVVNVDDDGNMDIDMCLGTSFTLNVINLDANDVLTYNWTGDIIEPGTENLANPTLNPSEPGVYSISLVTTNQFGCEQIDEIPVTVVDPNEVLAFEVEKECDGVTFNFTNNGSNEFDYIWTFDDPSNPSLEVTTNDAVYVYGVVGDYDVSLAIDVNLACVEPATQQVSVFDPILTAAFSYELVDCGPDGTTILFVDQSENPDNNTTGIGWVINGTEYSGETVEITFEESTDIDVIQTLTTAADCQTTSEESGLELDIIDAPNVPQDALTHCQNDTGIELNPGGNPDYSYSWAPAAGLSCTDCPNPMADPDLTTTYSVTITNNNSFLPCTLTEEVTLDVPTTIELELVDDFEIDCADATQLTVGSNIDVTFEWFENGTPIPNSDNDEIDIMPSGPVTYTVVATDAASGCSEEAAVTVTGTGLEVALDDETYICQDNLGQITVTSADPNDILTYEWEGTGNIEIIQEEDNSIFITTSQPGADTYTVTVSNQFGCTSVQSIDAVVLSEPQAPNLGQCEGMTVTFENADDPNAPYYIWDFGDGSPTVTGQVSPTHTYAETGDFDVTATLPNGDECYDNIALTANVNDETLEPAFNLGFADDCADIATVTFNNESISGNQGNIDSLLWDFGMFGTSNETNPTFEVEDSGTVTGTLTVFTDAGCEETVAINEPIEIINEVVDVPDLAACIDTDGTLNANPEDGYSYVWEGLDGESPSVLVNGEAVYTVTITNTAQECTSVQMVNVDNHDVISLDINDGMDAINECEEVDVVLTANTASPATIEWSNNETGSSIVVSTGDGTTGEASYTATATDANGCTETDVITVENHSIALDFDVPQDYSCEGGTALPEITAVPEPQSAQDNLTFNWSGGPLEDGTTSSPILMPTETTTYMVEVSNEFGCPFEEEFVINVSDVEATVLQEGIIASEDTIFIGNDVELDVILGDYEYDWNGDGVIENPMDDTNATATPTASGEATYQVFVTDINTPECSTTAAVTITVLQRTCDEPFIFFPNAFSPNGDSENDVLRLRYNPTHVTDASWAIYNRWGQKVYETNDLNGSWDGTFKGEAVAPDVYGFWLRTACSNGEEFHKQGNVTVLK